jgi:nitrosocyanin
MISKTVWAFMLTVLIAGCTPLPPGDSTGPPVKEFYLVTTDIAFGKVRVWFPSVIVLKAGEQANLVLENPMEFVHGFSVDELGIRELIQPGETKIITIKPEKPGNYQYYCHLHRTKHLGGSLLVQ